MRFTFKRGEKIFEVGEYARSQNAGSAVFKVLTAGPIVRWTEKEIKDLYEKDPAQYWTLQKGKIKFQENVTLRKVGKTFFQVKYEPCYHRIYSYQEFEHPSRRTIALTEDNFYIYRPAVWSSLRNTTYWLVSNPIKISF